MLIYSPNYQILIDYIPLSLVLEERLVSIHVDNTIEDDIDQLSLTFDDHPIDLVENLPLPPIGTRVLLYIGYVPKLTDMGLFYIDSWDLSMPPGVLKVTAKSLNLKGHFFDQKTKSWEKTTLKFLIETISAEHELIPYVGESYEEVEVQEFQNVESDANFLTRLAKQYNAFFKVAKEKLLFLEYNTFQSFSGSILGLVSLMPTDIISWSVSYRERQVFSKVVAKWQDYKLAKVQSESFPPAEFKGKVYELRKIFASQQEAYYAAKSKFESLERNKQYIQIQCKGNPNLTAGGKIELLGLRESLDGIWIVNRTSHTIDSNGYQSSINAYRLSLDDEL